MGSKVVPHNSKSDLPLAMYRIGEKQRLDRGFLLPIPVSCHSCSSIRGRATEHNRDGLMYTYKESKAHYYLYITLDQVADDPPGRL